MLYKAINKLIESEDMDLKNFIHDYALEYRPPRKILELESETFGLIKSRNRLEYHKQCLDDAKKKLSDFLEIGIEHYDQKAKEDYEKKLALYNKNNELINSRISKILKMRDEVQGWNPPTENHKGIKEHMLDGLNYLSTEVKREYAKPSLLSGQEWADMELSHIKNSISHHQREYDAEKPIQDLEKEWFESLINSLEQTTTKLVTK